MKNLINFSKPQISLSILQNQIKIQKRNEEKKNKTSDSKI